MGTKDDDMAFDLNTIEQGDLEDFEADPKLRGDYLSEDSESDDDDIDDNDEVDVIDTGTEDEDPEDEDPEDGGSEDEDPEDEDSEDEDSEDKDPEDEDSKDEDPEDEGSEDEDSKDNAESKDDKIRIPKARFDQVAKQKKAAEDRLAEYERRLGISGGEANEEVDARMGEIKTEIEELSGKLEQAMLDADDTEVAKLRKQETALRDELTDIKIERAAALARSAAIEETQFNSLVDKIEEDYPQFKNGHESFDQDLVNETVKLSETFQRGEGVTRAEAMFKAFTYTKSKYGLDSPDLEAIEDGEESKPKPKSRKTKTKTSRNKKAKSAQAPSAKSKKSALGSEAEIDFSSIVDPDQLDDIDPKKLAKLRGDIVEPK